MAIDFQRTATSAAAVQVTTNDYVDVALYESIEKSLSDQALGKSPWFRCITSGPLAVQAQNVAATNAATVQVLTTWDDSYADARCPVLIAATPVPLSSAVLLQALVVGPCWIKVQIKSSVAGAATDMRIILGQKRL